MPEKKDNRSNFICINAGDIGNFPIKLIIDLFHLGVDIYVAQPDYRMIFEVLARNEQSHSRVKLPIDRLLSHLHEEEPIGEIWTSECADYLLERRLRRFSEKEKVSLADSSVQQSCNYLNIDLLQNSTNLSPSELNQSIEKNYEELGTDD